MNKGTEFEIDKTLIDETDIIIQNECKWNGESPIVNVKEFKITCMQLWGAEKDITDDDTDDEILAWMQDANQVKILPLIATSNVYLLATLAALSKTLSVLIENSKTKIDNIEIDFLIGNGLIKHSKKFIKPPVDENYEPIILDFYKNNLTTVMEINFSELKSLLNILIASFKVKRVDLRKIIKNVNHTDIKDYHRGIAKIKKEAIGDIDKWVSEERETASDRVKEISFNEEYNLINMLLQIVMSLQQLTDNESNDKFILIVPDFMRDVINTFFTKSSGNSTKNELDKKRPSNIMFFSYTNPTNERKDPEVIVKRIPSYLTILSKYLNSNKIVYAIDEYFHSNLIDVLNNRKFQCEKFHEEILPKKQQKKGMKLSDYGSDKSKDLKNLKNEFENYKDDPNEHRADKLEEQLKNIKDSYIKKQKKELEVINDGFLTVQNDILEQLKLIL